MKPRSLTLVLVASLLTTSGFAGAAKEIGLGATYDARVPIGGFRDFVPDVSFSGLQAKWDYFPIEPLSFGLEVQYHRFDRDVETNTTSIANGAVTAPTYHYASLWSFLPTARYYFWTGRWRPYVAFGAGVTSVTSAILVSDLSQRDNGVAFIMQPSVGVLWRLWSTLTPRPGGDGDTSGPVSTPPLRKPLESMFGLTASLTYAFTTADAISGSNVGFAGLQLGIYAKP